MSHRSTRASKLLGSNNNNNNDGGIRSSLVWKNGKVVHTSPVRKNKKFITNSDIDEDDVEDEDADVDTTNKRKTKRDETTPDGNVLLPRKKSDTEVAYSSFLFRAAKRVVELEHKYNPRVVRGTWAVLAFPFYNVFTTARDFAVGLLCIIGLMKKPTANKRTTTTTTTTTAGGEGFATARHGSRMSGGIHAAPQHAAGASTSNTTTTTATTTATVSWTSALVFIVRALCAGFVVHLMVIAYDLYFSPMTLQRDTLARITLEYCKKRFADPIDYDENCARSVVWMNRPFIVNVMSDLSQHVLADILMFGTIVFDAIGVSLAWCGPGTHYFFLAEMFVDTIIHFVAWFIPVSCGVAILYAMYRFIETSVIKRMEITAAHQMTLLQHHAAFANASQTQSVPVASSSASPLALPPHPAVAAAYQQQQRQLQQQNQYAQHLSPQHMYEAPYFNGGGGGGGGVPLSYANARSSYGGESHTNTHNPPPPPPPLSTYIDDDGSTSSLSSPRYSPTTPPRPVGYVGGVTSPHHQAAYGTTAHRRHGSAAVGRDNTRPTSSPIHSGSVYQIVPPNYAAARNVV